MADFILVVHIWPSDIVLIWVSYVLKETNTVKDITYIEYCKVLTVRIFSDHRNVVIAEFMLLHNVYHCKKTALVIVQVFKASISFTNKPTFRNSI